MIPVGKNPPARYPNRPIREAQEFWWIAKVKPRQEKALADDLIQRQIEYYLPMYTKTTRRRDNNKPRKSVICLFPGYLSFCPPKGFERDIFTTNRIVSLIQIRNQSHFIKELEQIYHTIDLGISIEPFNSDGFTPGELVEVVTGPMKGIQGCVVKMHSSQKLILAVDMLGKAAVSIDASFVKALPHK